MTPRRTLFAFGLSGFAQNVVGTCIGVHLFVFYTDVVGLAPLWVSFGLTIATLWSAISDLLVGRVSDAARFRAGRRRPFILAGALPVALAFVALLAPPPSLRGDALGIYFTITLVVLFSATALTQVPALSLLPELATGYHERTRLAAARELFGNVGDLVGLLLPIVALLAIAGPAGGDAPAARSAFESAAGIGGALAMLALLATVAGTREKTVAVRPRPAPLGETLRALRGNRAWKALLGASFLGALAFAFVQTMVLYVLEHVMRERDPAVHLAAFTVNAVAAILSYPFWTWLSRRHGKPAAFRAGLALSSITFASVFFAGPGAHVLLFLVMAFSGAANVGFWVTLHALNADVTDVDELANGERREGLFAGFAALVRKIAFAVAAAGVGVGLTLVGHHAGTPPSAATVDGMKMLFAVPPTLLVLAALLVFRRFPMTRASHRMVRAALARGAVTTAIEPSPSRSRRMSLQVHDAPEPSCEPSR